MTIKVGSQRRKARNRLKKTIRTRGKVSLTKYFAKFDVGEGVILNAEPSVLRGMYAMRFHGRMCKVTGRQGECCVLQMKDGSKLKKLIVHPVHLKRASK